MGPSVLDLEDTKHAVCVCARVWLQERSRPGNGWGMRAGEACGPKGGALKLNLEPCYFCRANRPRTNTLTHQKFGIAPESLSESDDSLRIVNARSSGAGAAAPRRARSGLGLATGGIVAYCILIL